MSLEDIALLKNEFTEGSQLEKSLQFAYNLAYQIRSECQKGTYIQENLAGEVSVIHATETLKLAINIAELVVAHRGEPKDYILLASLTLKLGDCLQGKESTQKYQGAFKLVRKARSAKGSKDYMDYFFSGKIKSKWANYSDNDLKPGDRISLYNEAINDLSKGVEIQEKMKNRPKDMFLDYAELGYAWYCLAISLEKEKKIPALVESEKYFKKTLDLKKDGSYYHYHLAIVQEERLELASLDLSLSNPIKREMLRGEIVANYESSYNLDKDPKTLEKIEKVKMLQIL